MYPKNAALPPIIPVGAVVQISDGAVQTSGCTVSVRTSDDAETGGGGTVAYSTGGVVIYTPSQAETNHTWFFVTAYKTGCIPVGVLVVPTAAATPGTVQLQNSAGNAGINAPANFEDLSISDTTGLVSLAADQAVNVTKWLGTACHAAAINGVPVVQWHSAGTDGGVSAPANIEDLSITDTSGIVKADLVTINATSIAGTGSQIAAAFVKLFNVAAPTGTVNSLPDAVAGASGGLAIVGSAMGLANGSIITATFGSCVPPAPSGMSTLTQSQVSGGAYDLTNATFVAAFKSALGTVPASGNWATTGAAMTLANGSIVTATFGTCVTPETANTNKLRFTQVP